MFYVLFVGFFLHLNELFYKNTMFHNKIPWFWGVRVYTYFTVFR